MLIIGMRLQYILLNILIRMVVKICCVRIQFQYIIIVQVGLVEDNGLRDV